MDKLIENAMRQGVHRDIVAVADELAADCPKWANFILRLKQRAQENIEFAEEVLKIV